MNLAGVQPGDVVLADRKGRQFYAIVCGKGQGELQVEPIDRRITYHHVKAREVLEIWHKPRRRNGAGPSEPDGGL
jgi:hypothetical protein